MTGRTRMTEGSGLELLAQLFKAAHEIESSDLWRKFVLLQQLARVAPYLIRGELTHIDWLYENQVDDVLHGYAVEQAHELGLKSDEADGDPLPNNEDVLEALQRPAARPLARRAGRTVRSRRAGGDPSGAEGTYGGERIATLIRATAPAQASGRVFSCLALREIRDRRVY
jgi:hypothetical protein